MRTSFKTIVSENAAVPSSLWVTLNLCKKILLLVITWNKKHSSKQVVFPPIFVSDIKIIYGYNFAAPLRYDDYLFLS